MSEMLKLIPDIKCASRHFGLDAIRKYLNEISNRETIGVPVGILLVPKKYAGVIKEDWNKIRKLGKLGFKKVNQVPGDDNYVLLHLSNNSANIIADAWEKRSLLNVNNIIDTSENNISPNNPKPIRVWQNSEHKPRHCHRINTNDEDNLVIQYLNDHPYVEFYRGIRVYDPVLNADQYFSLHNTRSTNINSTYADFSKDHTYINNGLTPLLDNNNFSNINNTNTNTNNTNFSNTTNTTNTTTNTNNTNNTNRFTFIEVFAGIGGFRLGLEAVGGVCVYASELDIDAQYTYTLNFPKYI